MTFRACKNQLIVLKPSNEMSRKKRKKSQASRTMSMILIKRRHRSRPYGEQLPCASSVSMSACHKSSHLKPQLMGGSSYSNTWHTIYQWVSSRDLRATEVINTCNSCRITRRNTPKEPIKILRSGKRSHTLLKARKSRKTSCWRTGYVKR